MGVIIFIAAGSYQFFPLTQATNEFTLEKFNAIYVGSQISGKSIETNSSTLAHEICQSIICILLKQVGVIHMIF